MEIGKTITLAKFSPWSYKLSSQTQSGTYGHFWVGSWEGWSVQACDPFGTFLKAAGWAEGSGGIS